MSESFRILPLVVVAGLCLLALKAMGLVLSGGYVVSGVAPASAQNVPAVAEKSPAPSVPSEEKNLDSRASLQKSESKSEANAADSMSGGKTVPDEVVAASAGENPDDKSASKPTAAPRGRVSETSKSELAVLEGLANRRKQLDTRERKIDLRENLLKAAEKRIEARITELKAIEAKIERELKKRDDRRKAQYDNLVKLYSSMKPKDAARIFNTMELEIMTGLSLQMKPRVLSAIMAAMKPTVAQRLTLEMATQGNPNRKSAAVLPKIESQKTN